MKRRYRFLFMLSIMVTVLSMLLASCAAPAAPDAPDAPDATQPTAQVQVPADAETPVQETGPVTMTDVGTPRFETVIVQTFDRQAANPDQHNMLMDYNIWRGVRELCMGYLWETDTATGISNPEIAAAMPEVLNDTHTRFRITLRQDLKWSDGVPFTADDVIYTLDTYFEYKDRLTYWGVPAVTGYVKSYSKIDDYTIEIETFYPAFDIPIFLGIETWGSRFNIVPKHVFEKEADVSQFRNTYPVCLGPYTLQEFDPSGFWALWQRRDDWQNSSWGWQGEPKARYVLYKDFGPEERRVMAFTQNLYDVDTFMSPDSIKAAKAMNEHIETWNPLMPYHNMNDACQYGLLINNLKEPYNILEVRWALALALDLKNVGINAMHGEFMASALPMVDTPVLRPLYYEPNMEFLRNLTLPDGYKPFNENFAADLAAALTERGATDIPTTEEELKAGFGLGWWNHDPEQATRLLESVGFTRGNDGIWLKPDGNVWEINFIFPGDWNNVMQRTGFAIADSWTKFGLKVNARQLDNAGWGTAMNTNEQLEILYNWTPFCSFVPNTTNAYRALTTEFLQDAYSVDPIRGNLIRFGT
ncbi:MAG TPA: ABC transporter substrate-binding protein, partial [Levilinea sp.]|nr:ABC transporter substrate-binding protein [Levilinea sp.]